MKGKIVTVFVTVMGLLTGILVGICIAQSIDIEGTSFGQFIVQYVGKMLLAAVAFVMTTAIHEAGHLVFGLMTGYQFVSYRIGPVMLMKKNGKLQLKKLSLAGTGGQCLLKPPVMKDGLYPYKLYHMGGALMNLIAAAVCGLLSLAFGDVSILKLFCQLMVITNIYTAMVNGIPLMTNVANDGYNVMTLGRNPRGLAQIWRQLMVNAEQAEGKKLTEIDETLFVNPEVIDDLNTASEAVLWENLLMSRHQFDDALQQCDRLLDSQHILPLYRCFLICDKIYCQFLQGNYDVSLLKDKDMVQFMAHMKDNISVIRTNYIVALKADKDQAKADKYLQHFEKTAKNHPYSGDIEAERELLSLIN